MDYANIHVVPRNAQDWVVEEEGSGREFGHYPTQEAAEDVGRALARKRKVELLVHGRDGSIHRRKLRSNGWPWQWFK